MQEILVTSKVTCPGKIYFPKWLSLFGVVEKQALIAGWPVLFVLYKYLFIQLKIRFFLAQADHFTIIGRLLAARTSGLHLQQAFKYKYISKLRGIHFKLR